jgi:fumarylacetoacetase
MEPAIVDIPAGSDFPLENLPYGAVVVSGGVGASASASSSPSSRRPHLAVALGDHAVDLCALSQRGLLCTGPILSQFPHVFEQPTLNAFLELGPEAWREARAVLSRLLSSREGALRDLPAEARGAVLLPRPDAAASPPSKAPPPPPPPPPPALASTTAAPSSLLSPSSRRQSALPITIGDYTDFYASRHHATNVGAMFRGVGNELQPNWLHLPVGYHGRASSVVVSGQPVARPWGQIVVPPSSSSSSAAETKPAAGNAPAPAPSHPIFSPSRAVDYELEVAAVVGVGSGLNGPGIPARTALSDGHLFGLLLMNDWSARDVQRWEGVPLGPFTAKNWATQVSPWVVTAEALEPYRLDLPAQRDPAALPYLTDEGRCAAAEEEGEEEEAAASKRRREEEEEEEEERGRSPRPRPGALASYDLQLRAELLPAGASRPTRLCDTNLRHLYWSFPQMAAHHTAGGCNLRAGDLLGSGTVSGPGAGQRACLLEATGNGARAFELEDAGEAGKRERRYLEDGDEVVIRGWCGGDGEEEGEEEEEGAGGGCGLPRIGFGECRGRLLPALRRRGAGAA